MKLNNNDSPHEYSHMQRTMESYIVWSFFVIKTSHTQGAILKLVQDNTLQIILQNNNSKDGIEKN